MSKKFEYVSAYASVPLNLGRQKYGPLDGSSVFKNKTDALYYILFSKNAEAGVEDKDWYQDISAADSYVKEMKKYAYVGQVVTVFDGDDVGVYKIISVPDEGELSGLEGELSTWEGEFLERVDVNDAISQIHSELSGVHDDIERVNFSVTQLDLQLTHETESINGRMNELSDEVGGIGDRLSVVEGQLSDNVDDIVQLRNDLAAKQDALNEAQLSVVDIEAENLVKRMYVDPITEIELQYKDEQFHDITTVISVDLSGYVDDEVILGVLPEGRNSDDVHSIKFGTNVTEIGGSIWVFTSLERIELQEGLERIDNLGQGVAQWNSLVVPKSVTYIGENAFERVSPSMPLTSMVFTDRTVEEIKAMENFPWGLEGGDLDALYASNQSSRILNQITVDIQQLSDEADYMTGNFELLQENVAELSNGLSDYLQLSGGFISGELVIDGDGMVALPYLSNVLFQLDEPSPNGRRDAPTGIKDLRWKLDSMDEAIQDASDRAAGCLPLSGGTLSGDLSVYGNQMNLAFVGGSYPIRIFDSNASDGFCIQQIKDDQDVDTFCFFGVDSADNHVVRMKDLPTELSAEEGGNETTLVTTGDKWNWDNKAETSAVDQISDYLPIKQVNGGWNIQLPNGEELSIGGQELEGSITPLRVNSSGTTQAFYLSANNLGTNVLVVNNNISSKGLQAFNNIYHATEDGYQYLGTEVKNYVDGRIDENKDFLPLSGGVMSGAIEFDYGGFGGPTIMAYNPGSIQIGTTWTELSNKYVTIDMDRLSSEPGQIAFLEDIDAALSALPKGEYLPLSGGVISDEGMTATFDSQDGIVLEVSGTTVQIEDNGLDISGDVNVVGGELNLLDSKIKLNRNFIDLGGEIMFGNPDAADCGIWKVISGEYGEEYSERYIFSYAQDDETGFHVAQENDANVMRGGDVFLTLSGYLPLSGGNIDGSVSADGFNIHCGSGGSVGLRDAGEKKMNIVWEDENEAMYNRYVMVDFDKVQPDEIAEIAFVSDISAAVDGVTSILSDFDDSGLDWDNPSLSEMGRMLKFVFNKLGGRPLSGT